MEPAPGDQVGAKRPAENPLPSAPVDVKHARPSPDLPTVTAPTLPPMTLSSASAIGPAPTINPAGTVGTAATNHPSPHLYPSPVQPQMPLVPPQAAQAGHPPATAPASASVSAVLNTGLPTTLTPIQPMLSGISSLPSPVQSIPPMQSSLSLATSHAPQPPIHPPLPSSQPKPPGQIPPPNFVAPAPPSHPIPHIPQQPQQPSTSSLAVKSLAPVGQQHSVPSRGGHVPASVHHPQVREREMPPAARERRPQTARSPPRYPRRTHCQGVLWNSETCHMPGVYGP
jgi:hypothetical protein